MHAIMHVSGDVVFTMDTSGFAMFFQKPHLPPPCERNYSIKYPFTNGCITRLKCGDSGEPLIIVPPTLLGITICDVLRICVEGLRIDLVTTLRFPMILLV